MASPVTGVTGSSTSNTTQESAASRVPIQTLGQNDFLKLLVAQLSSQDPMNPQKDSEFIGQMAQFSALENSKGLQTEMESLRAAQMIGQTVQIKIDGDSSVYGVVSAVDSSSGTAQVVVGGRPYPLSSVTRMQQAATNNPVYAK